MSLHRYYGARATLRALTGLDVGLRVRVYRQLQRVLFSGTENGAALDLISELSKEVVRMRVFSYALRGQIEDTLSALQLNAEAGSWRYARRAALDLVGVLSQGCRRRLVDDDRAVRGAEYAARIAELIGLEAR